jgi:4-hydroxybenzoate polyprenyltransferase
MKVHALGKLRAYLQLCRLPNVFTALADVLMGFFFVCHTLPPDAAQSLAILALLLSASALLYSAGIVLNDVYDLETDRVERPQRPLPSGRIPLRVASRLGFGMLAAGVLSGWLAAAVCRSWLSGAVATGIAAAVWLYDAALKRSAAGPVAMGACRALNVLLGMSAIQGASAIPWEKAHYVVAAAMGTYITGVTWFARTEARRSSAWQLVGGLVVLECGILLLAWLPAWARQGTTPLLLDEQHWRLLILTLGALIGFRCLRAVLEPEPARVQIAVKICIWSLIMLDAAVCLAVRGSTPALLVLALLIPTVTLGRWIYTT